MEQLDLFDYMPPIEEPITYCSVKDDGIILGRSIPFHELKHMIGRNVFYVENGRKKVIKVIRYSENARTVYKRVRPLPANDIGYGEYVNEYIHDVVGIKSCMACYEPYRKYDLIQYTESNKRSKDFLQISEEYCKGGVLSNGRGIEFFDIPE